MAGELIRTGALAKALGVSRQAVLDWIAKGIITPASRTPGGQYRWRLEDVERQLAKHERGR